jgi:hypothetical protein
MNVKPIRVTIERIVPTNDQVRAELLKACDQAALAEDYLRDSWNETTANDLREALIHSSRRLLALENNLANLHRLNRNPGQPVSEPYLQTR